MARTDAIAGADPRTELEERAIAALRASIDGMAVIDEDGSHRFVNNAYARVFGFEDPVRLFEQRWESLVPSYEEERIKEKVLPALERDGGWRGTVDARRRDGTTFPLELSLTLLANGERLAAVRDVSDRERRRQNLELAHELARLGHWAWDIRSGQVRWSEGLYELFGKDPEGFEPTYESYRELVHPADRPAFEAQLEEAIDEEGLYRSEHRVELDDGTVRTFRTNGRLETDEEGEPVRMFGTCMDVTPLRRREQAQKVAERRLDAVLDGFDVHVIEVRGTPSQPEVRCVTGGPGEAWDRFPVSDGRPGGDVHPGDEEAIRRALTLVLEEGEPADVLYREPPSEDEEPTWIEAHLLPDPDGEDAIAVLQEVTRRVEANQGIVDARMEHRRARRRRRLAEELGGVGTWTWWPVSDRLDASERLLELLGIEQAAFGASLDAFLERVAPEDRERVRGRILDAMRGEGVFEIEHRLRPEQDRTVPVRSVGHPVPGGLGCPLRFDAATVRCDGPG